MKKITRIGVGGPVGSGKTAVIEAVVAGAKIDIPEAMIEDRIDERLNEFTMNMRYQGLDMETYYKITGQTEESIREQMKPMAENDVRTRLVLEAIQEAEAAQDLMQSGKSAGKIVLTVR